MKSGLLLLQKIMRFIGIIITVVVSASQFLLAENSLGQVLETRVQLHYTEANLYEVIVGIQRNTGIAFAFTDQLGLDKIKVHNVSFDNSRLGDVLQDLLPNHAIDFEEISGTIKLQKLQAPGKISGHVSDKQGQPIVGASIRIAELNRSIVSDGNGNFSTSVRAGTYTLDISYVSYKAQRSSGITVNQGQTVSLSFVLEEEVGELEDVVVIGYGTQRKMDLTGSIASVTNKQIENKPVTNIIQALQGKVPGMDIQNAGGAPGAASSIRIRGNRSITASNDPLIVLDGIPTATSINDINFSDIMSVEVLKDASATAIYGSRGANGVILLTTKKGQQGKVNVNYDGYYGINNPFGKLTVFNAEEYAAYKQVGGKQLGQWEKDALAAGTYTDYQKFLYKDSYQQNHSLSFSGGNEKTLFYISGNYFDNQGTVPQASYDRYNLRVNLDQKINEKLSIGTTTLLSRSIQNAGVYPLFSALQLNPMSVPYLPDGSVNYTPDDESLHTNPLLEILGASTDETRHTTVISNIYGEYKIIDGLKYRLNIGLNNDDSRRGYYDSAMKNNGASTGGWQDGSTFDYTIENILSYQLTHEAHKLDLTALYSVEGHTQESEQLDVRDIPYDNQEFYNLGSAEEVTGRGSNYLKWGIASYMARAQYGYNEKYLVTLTMRADGASMFAPGHKWGYFPSGALAWRITEEDFMKNQEFINELKLRVSYGVVGNPGISPYRTQGTLQRTTYSWEDQPAYGYGPGDIANPDLKWESTASTNIGIDFKLLKGKVGGTVDLYQQDTRDLLLERALPSSTGFSSTLQNVGKTRNKGAELTLNLTPLPTESKFQWNIELNAFTNSEKIVALNSGVTADIGNKWFVGHPISVFYDYEKIGIWQTSEKDEAAVYKAVPGQIRIKDQDGNQVIDDKDRVILGTNRPKWGGGLTSSFAYAGFDLSFSIYTRNGQMISDGYYGMINQMEAKQNNLKVDYWSETNPTNVNPQPKDLSGMQYLSTLRYFNGSYTTLQNADIGYSFSQNVARRLTLNSLRVYLSGMNLLLLSKNYRPAVTYLPENNGSAGIPLNRTFNIGLNIGL